jgi:hypothetical protein
MKHKVFVVSETPTHEAQIRSNDKLIAWPLDPLPMGSD